MQFIQVTYSVWPFIFSWVSLCFRTSCLCWGAILTNTLRLQMSTWLGYGQLKNVSLDVRTYSL